MLAQSTLYGLMRSLTRQVRNVRTCFHTLLVLVVFLYLPACDDKPEKKDIEWRNIGLPVLSGTIELSVAIASNSRFPQLPDSSIQMLLARTREMVQQHFGISVVFTDPRNISINQLFNGLSPPLKQKRKDEIIDIHALDDSTREHMRQSIYETLGNYSADRQKVIDYAKPYLDAPLEKESFLQLSEALAVTLENRLKYWYQLKAADGRPVLDGTPYNEWVWWDSLGYTDMAYDVIITNQLVASAELYAMDVHSTLRGGITAGTTSYSKHATLNAYSWMTLYPLLNDAGLLAGLRNDETYSDEQIIDYGATLLTHELGHLLLHLGHPFGNSQCIMSPMPLLKFREWHDGLDPDGCRLRSEEQMVPGAANIEYRVDL